MTDRLGRRLLGAVKLASYETRITKAVKAALAKHQAHATATLRASAHPDSFNVVSWDTTVDQTVAPVVLSVLQDAAANSVAFLRLSAEDRARVLGQLDVSTQAATFVDRIKGIGPDVAASLQDALTQGLGAGESIPDLQARIEDVFAVGERRSEMIARTEVHASAMEAGNASAQALHDSGLGLAKEWLAYIDDRTRDEHIDANGQVVAMDDPFIVGGEEMMYPGDDNGSAENVINCRCDVIYDTPEALGLDTGAAPPPVPEEDTTPVPVAESPYPDFARTALQELEGVEFDQGGMAEWEHDWRRMSGAPGELALDVEARIKSLGSSIHDEAERRVADAGISAPMTVEERQAALAESDNLWAAYQKARDEQGGYALVERERWLNSKVDLDASPTAYIEAYRDAVRESLAEIRPMGGPLKTDINVKGWTSDVQAAFDKTTSYYPTSWLEASNDRGTLNVIRTDRGYYLGARNELAVSGTMHDENDLIRVIAHEMGHRSEDVVPGIKETEWVWEQRRTYTGNDVVYGSREVAATGHRDYGPGESGRADEYLTPYIGRSYGDSPTSFHEVLSVGMESLLTGSNRLWEDPDYRSLILGMLGHL